MTDIKVRRAKIEDLIQDDRNANLGTEEGSEMLTRSLAEHGAGRSVLVDKSGRLIAGNKTTLKALAAGINNVIIVQTTGDELVAVQRDDIDLDSPEGRALAVSDNRVAQVSLNWDEERLREFLKEGVELDAYFSEEELQRILAADQPEDEPPPDLSNLPSLLARFLLVPFTILDARSGPWRDRKAEWVAFGLKSEMGRGADDDGTERGLTYSASAQPPSVYEAKNKYEAEVGRKVGWDEFYAANPDAAAQTNTSIFDPVLAELAYRWFCPPEGKVLDPFAGGSVRGVIAELLRRRYTGVDLSKRQIDENEKQAAHFKVMPRWIVGNSQDIPTLLKPDEQFDFIFSCPPYFDLEVYSDDPDDLSAKSNYQGFLDSYRDIIKKACERLKQDRFAVFVVGDLRDKKTGLYQNFVSDTIGAFRDAGLGLYNEAILITQAGSLAIRVGAQFSKSRKLGKTHQNVLVFVKGDPKKATEACGEVEIEMPAEAGTESEE